MIRINVTDENGVLLDTVEMTREEFIRAQGDAIAALSVLGNISIGSEA